MNPNYKEILKQIMEYKSEGLRVLIAGLLIKLIIGFFYAWPILQSYHQILIGYSSLSNQYFLFVSYPTMVLIMNLTLPYSDFFLKKFGAQAIVCISTCLLCISIMMIAILSQSWIIHYVLLIFVVSPLIGILYSTPFLLTWKYFVKQKQYLNSIYQIFIGLGAFLTIVIFSSNQNNQLQLFYDDNQQFCGECFNLQIRQSLKGTAIWIFLLGIVATLLVKQPDMEVADNVVDYDLLAFSHLDLPKQQQVDTNISFDQPPQLTFVQALSSKQFKVMSAIVASSSFLSFFFFSQYQRVLKVYGISYQESVYSYELTIFIYGFMRLMVNLFIIDLQNEKTLKLLGNLNIFLITLFSLSFFYQEKLLIVIIVSAFVVQMAVVFSVISTLIPKLFGSIASQGVFSFMLAVMGISALISNSVGYFYTGEQTKGMLFYFTIKLFIIQLFVSFK